MRRLQLGFAAGALISAAVLAGMLAARRWAPPVAVTAVSASQPAPPAAPPAAPTPVTPVAPVAESSPPPRAAPLATPRPPAASRAEAEMVALEERALRAVDIVAVLEASGIDVRELEKRADADDVLRRLAADELLTRRYLRFLYGTGAFKPGVRREAAPHDARTAAQQIVAGFSPAERAAQLARELDEAPSD